jgi:hypothetical protein
VQLHEQHLQELVVFRAAAASALADWSLQLLVPQDCCRRLPQPHKEKQQQVLQCSCQAPQLSECQQLLLGCQLRMVCYHMLLLLLHHALHTAAAAAAGVACVSAPQALKSAHACLAAAQPARWQLPCALAGFLCTAHYLHLCQLLRPQPPLSLLLLQVGVQVPAGPQCLMPALLATVAAAAAATVVVDILHPAHCPCKHQQLLQLHVLLLPPLPHPPAACRQHCPSSNRQPPHALCWVHLLLMA